MPFLEMFPDLQFGSFCFYKMIEFEEQIPQILFASIAYFTVEIVEEVHI